MSAPKFIESPVACVFFFFPVKQCDQSQLKKLQTKYCTECICSSTSVFPLYVWWVISVISHFWTMCIYSFLFIPWSFHSIKYEWFLLVVLQIDLKVTVFLIHLRHLQRYSLIITWSIEFWQHLLIVCSFIHCRRKVKDFFSEPASRVTSTNMDLNFNILMG